MRRLLALALIAGTVGFASGCSDRNVDIQPVAGGEGQYVIIDYGGTRLSQHAIDTACPGRQPPAGVEKVGHDGDVALLDCVKGKD